MNIIKVIEINNPIFVGFYETSLNGSFQEDFEKKCINERFNVEVDYIEWDYKKFEKEVSSGINDLFIEKANEKIYELFGIKNLFIRKYNEELQSPKFYNYETDKTFIKTVVNEAKYRSFINKMFNQHWNLLKTMIEHNHKSYPGFHSFYSWDVEEWYNKRFEFDYFELGTIFETLLEIGRDYSDYDNYDEIVEDVFNQMELTYYIDDKPYKYDELMELKDEEN